MEIIEVFDDHVTVYAYDLPSGTVDANNLYDSEDIAEVGYDYKQCGDELTGDIYVTVVTIDNEKVSTTFVDRNLMASYIQDHFEELANYAKQAKIEDMECGYA